MGVFTFAAQDPRSMSDNVTTLFGAPNTAATSSTMGKSKSKSTKSKDQPQYFSAYASMRAASPPTSNYSSFSHSSVDESSTDEAMSEDEEEAVIPLDSCNQATTTSDAGKSKLSRAFKNLKKLGGK
jgi:hypothetical protein